MKIQNDLDNMVVFSTINLSEVTRNKNHDHISITRIFSGHIYHITQIDNPKIITSVFVPRG